MKKLLILLLCIPLMGCQEAAKVSDFSLGMKYEQAVNVCTQGMKFIETKQDGDVVKSRYSVKVPMDGISGALGGTTPYVLIFEQQPDLENKLTQIALDEDALLRRAIINAGNNR